MGCPVPVVVKDWLTDSARGLVLDGGILHTLKISLHRTIPYLFGYKTGISQYSKKG